MTVTYGKKATYNGINFRSLLEARWACFLDLLHLPWSYEAKQQKRWICDFVFYFSEIVLVELKPETMDAELRKQRNRTAGSGWQGRILLLGENPNLPEGRETNKVGLIFEVGLKVSDTKDAKVLRCEACHRYSISWEGDHCQYMDCTGPTEAVFSKFLEDKWKEAGNVTQWMAQE